MNAASAIREGLRAVLRQPVLVLSEIAWRWSFGSAAWLLIALTGFEYLDSLTVSGADLLLLRTRHPALVARAISDVFRDSGPRLAQGTIILVIALLVFWTVAASIGQLVMLRTLLPRVSMRPIDPRSSGPGTFRSLLGINFLRASLAFAAVLAAFSGLIFAGLVAPTSAEDAGIAANLLMSIALIVWLLWSGLNWLLSLAIISGEDTFGSISAAVNLLRQSSSKMTGVSLLFTFVHGFAFLLAGTAFFAVIGMTTQISDRAAALLCLMIALAYFAFADFLYVVRVATYAAIAESSPEIPTALTPRDFPPFIEARAAT